MAFVITVLFYFIPTLIAYGRKHRSRQTVGILNLVFGWTGIGWVICLVWALNK